MKKTLILALALAGAMAFAGEKQEAKYVDPNPFANYGPAMQSTKEHPLAVNWSRRHDAEIARATSDAALKAVVADAASAAALLAKVKPAYASDPLVLTQVAAVTQWVMWKKGADAAARAAGRAVWTAALGRVVKETSDDYVRTFCRQQLDLCK